METQAHSEANPAAIDQGSEPPAIPSPEARSREELRMLFFGFGLGITVGAVFLIYIVLDAAHLLV